MLCRGISFKQPKNKVGGKPMRCNRKILSRILLSDKRLSIIQLLHKKEKTLPELRQELEFPSSNLIPQIKILEDEDIVERRGDSYLLTDKGRLIEETVELLCSRLKFFEWDREFWREHSLSGIPIEFQRRLQELGDYKVVRGDPAEVFKPHEQFMRNLLNAEWVKGVAPIFHDEYPEFFLKLVESGIDVDLIVTEDVFNVIESDHREKLERGLEYSNSRLLLCDVDIKVAFTVTNSFISLGLFRNVGDYDASSDLVSYDASAVKWGRELFSYFEKHSQSIDL